MGGFQEDYPNQSQASRWSRSAREKGLVSRGRCGREIARLRRLAAVVAAIFLRF